MRLYQRKRGGFSAIETLISLTVLGIIIAGVFAGQRTIENARLSKTINDVLALESQFNSYTQNYGALPGDDNAASKRFSNSELSTGNGDGILQGTFDSTNSEDETRLLWADLRGAELTVGAKASTSQPLNPFGGIYGFQNGAFNGTFRSIVLCLNNVPGFSAQAIDSKLDDGLSHTGKVQAIISQGILGESVRGTPAKTYGGNALYTVCIEM